MENDKKRENVLKQESTLETEREYDTSYCMETQQLTLWTGYQCNDKSKRTKPETQITIDVGIGIDVLIIMME